MRLNLNEKQRRKTDGKPNRVYSGFYGCAANGKARLVRLLWTGPASAFGPKKRHTVECPVCHEVHLIEVWWRLRRESDLEPELVLG